MKESVLMFCSECGNKIKKQQSSSESFGVLETFETNAKIIDGDLSELYKHISESEEKKVISKENIVYAAEEPVNFRKSHDNKNVLDNAETTLLMYMIYTAIYSRIRKITTRLLQYQTASCLNSRKKLKA